MPSRRSVVPGSTGQTSPHPIVTTTSAQAASSSGRELPGHAAGEVVAALGHHLDDLRVQPLLGPAARRTHLVAAPTLEERVRHLGAPGVADAEEEDVHDGVG